MSTLLIIFVLITSFWGLAGIVVGLFGYLYFGWQPKYLGWLLAIVTEIFLGLAIWDEGIIPIILVVNFPIVALMSLHFQSKADEEENNDRYSQGDALGIVIGYGGIDLNLAERFSSLWINMSIPFTSSLGGLSLLFSSLNTDLFDEGVFYSFSAMSIVLMEARFKGGRKGGLWSSLKSLTKVKIGFLPKPVPSQRP